MTRGDLLVRTLDIVARQPLPHLWNVVKYLEEQGVNLGMEVSPEEQAKMEKAIAAREPHILEWYIRILLRNPALQRDRVEAIRRQKTQRSRYPRARMRERL